MPQRSDKWIGSIKDNPAGKVVADPEGSRWEWQSDDETARLLRRLNNDELAIEATDIRPVPPQASEPAAPGGSPPPRTRRPKPGGRDSGGGFNPYDHAGKPKRR